MTHQTPNDPRRRRVRRLTAASCAGVLLLSACGGAPTSDPEPSAASNDAEVAPECHDVDQLEARLPEGDEPTGTTAEPLGDSSTTDNGDADADDAAAVDVSTLPPAIEAWAQQEAADSFAGVWLDQDLDGFAVAFADDVDRYAAEIREQIHPGLAVAEATHPYVELREIQDRVTEEQMGPAGRASGSVQSAGAHVMINRVTVGVFDPDDERLEELSETYGATAICFEIEAAPTAPSEEIDTLAKASGWREALTEEHGGAFAVLEVAYDREAAEAAWRDNVPDDLEPRDDELPAAPGVYGDLDRIDFDRQVVVVWSSGESGSCPGWLGSIDSADGTIHVERDATGEECMGDYNPYRLVLAVDRDRLPSADELPASRLEGVPDGEVRTYPVDDG